MNLTPHSDQPIVQRHAKAVVVGLGVTGYSVARYLRARGISVTVVDSRSAPPMAQELRQFDASIKTVFEDFESDAAAQVISSARLLVVNPGISLKTPCLQRAAKNGAEITGDIELFLQENNKPLIAITGSNGKSTVTALVGKMVEAGGQTPLVGGNIGYAALDALTDKIDFDVAVLELSSFQLETVNSIHADAAAILNISEDHMDRYDSFGDYVLAKSRILKNATAAVLPKHDSVVSQITTTADLRHFSLQEPSTAHEYGVRRINSRRWLVKGESKLVKLRDVPLVGTHNVTNVLAAYALVEGFAYDTKALRTAVKQMVGLPHRMESVGEWNKIRWVNDSKATNVGATASALKSIEQPIVWIAGGDGKGADFTDLAEAVSDNVRCLITLGRDGHLIAAAVGSKVPVITVSSMREAVRKASEQAVPEDVVLLSPACASFDMFRNYQHRGDEFSAQVKALMQEATQ